MQEVTTSSFVFPSTSRDARSEILRQGAQAMLTTTIETEGAEWISSHRQQLRVERTAKLFSPAGATGNG